MNPYLLKFLVMFILVVIFTIVLIVFYLFYKNVLRPLMIRLFNYKKVLYTAQLIMKSELDNKNKIEDLIKSNITDRDLIKIAEEEIKKANTKKININSDNKLKSSIKNIFKRDKIGNEKKIQQSERQGNTGISRGSRSIKEERNRRENETPNPESNNRPTKSRDFQTESSGRVTRTKKYFS